MAAEVSWFKRKMPTLRWCIWEETNGQAGHADHPSPRPKIKTWDDNLLSSRLIGLGDVGRLLHGPNTFHPRHQYRGLAGLHGATRGYSHHDRRRTLVVRHIDDEHQIIVTETIPTANQFAPNGLAGWTSRGFNSVLRILRAVPPTTPACRLSGTCIMACSTSLVIVRMSFTSMSVTLRGEADR